MQLDFIEASEVEDERGKSAEAQRLTELEQALGVANSERDRALLHELRALAIFAQQASTSGDHPTAMLLALEALPEPGFGGERPLSTRRRRPCIRPGSGAG